MTTPLKYHPSVAELLASGDVVVNPNDEKERLDVLKVVPSAVFSHLAQQEADGFLDSIFETIVAVYKCDPRQLNGPLKVPFSADYTTETEPNGFVIQQLLRKQYKVKLGSCDMGPACDCTVMYGCIHPSVYRPCYVIRWT